jgi:hypothetical protein
MNVWLLKRFIEERSQPYFINQKDEEKIKSILYLFLSTTPWRYEGEMQVWLHHCTRWWVLCFTIRPFYQWIKNSITDWIGGWVYPRSVLDVERKTIISIGNRKSLVYQLIQTPWLQSASELYRPSDRRVSAKLVPTFADRGCCVVSATDPHGRILGLLDRSRYYFFQVAPQLNSWGWVDPVSDPLLLRKSGSARNRTRDLWICSQELWPLDHRGGTELVQVT